MANLPTPFVWADDIFATDPLQQAPFEAGLSTCDWTGNTLNGALYMITGWLSEAVDCIVPVSFATVSDVINGANPDSVITVDIFDISVCLALIRKGGQSFSAECGTTLPVTASDGDMFVVVNAAGDAVSGAHIWADGAWQDVTAMIGADTCLNCASGDTWCFDGTSWTLGGASNGLPANSFFATTEAGSESSNTGNFGLPMPHTVTQAGILKANVREFQEAGASGTADLRFAFATVAVSVGDVVDWFTDGNGTHISLNGTVIAEADAVVGGVGTSTSQMTAYPSGQNLLFGATHAPPLIGDLVSSLFTSQGASFQLYQQAN